MTKTQCSIEGQLDNSIHIHIGGTNCYIVISQQENTIYWQVGSSQTKRYIANGYSTDYIDALERALSLFFILDNLPDLNFKAKTILNASIKSAGTYTKVEI